MQFNNKCIYLIFIFFIFLSEINLNKHKFKNETIINIRKLR